MPKDKKDQKKPASEQKTGAAQKIRQGKAELTDKELAKVSGGANKSNDFHF